MASAAAEEAVRTYLTALRDPASLRDDDKVAELERTLAATDDPLDRVHVRQQLLDARQPSAERFEEAFTRHAKAWAEEHGVSVEAFTSEGVPASVLRRAGFAVRGGRARKAAGRPAGRRVSSDEVRQAIPRGSFSVPSLVERTGASTAVVRRVVQEELAAGRITEIGPDPDHRSRGRAPTLYRRG